MTDLKFVPPIQVGTERVVGVVPTGGLGEIDLPIWSEDNPERGKRLRAMRRETGLTMGQVARGTGLAVYEVSWLECGNASVDEVVYAARLKEIAEVVERDRVSG